MFRLVRYFSITSLIFFVIVAGIFTYRSYNNSITDMVAIRERSNVELTQAYANVIWAEHGDFILSADTMTSDEILNSSELAALDTTIRNLTTGLPIIRIKIYALNGITIYSSDSSQIGEDKSDNVGFVAALNGEAASDLMFQDSFNAFEGVIEDRDVVESFVALRPTNSDEIQGVVEIYDDVSPLMQQIDNRQRRVVAGLISVFTLLYIILFFLMSYAERIMHRQAREIQIQNVELAAINQKLLHANQIATEAARLKSEFLSTMSHELRTPLNAIIGYSGIIVEGVTGEANQRTMGMVKKMHTSGQHLLTLINNILDTSKIEAGRMEIVEDVMIVRNVVADTRDQIEILAENKNLEFNLHIADTVPNTIIGDAERIKQILINLLSNAVKFTEEGSIALDMSWENNRLLIQVSDTGVGIPPHALDTIFEEFRQVDSTSTRAYQGTGLGLAIVRKFTEAMNGIVTVKSEVDSGTTFTVKLPLRLASDEVPATTEKVT